MVIKYELKLLLNAFYLNYFYAKHSENSLKNKLH